MEVKKCLKCGVKVPVEIGSTGTTVLCEHGPGPKDELICPGSGDLAIVNTFEAAKAKNQEAKA